MTTSNDDSAQAPHIVLTDRTVPRRKREVATAHAGFDRLAYPGDEVMSQLWSNSNMAWTGFYLAPAPSQPNTSWMTKARTLREMGWGLAPIYVGQQASGGPGSHVLTSAQGTADAAGAVALADAADIGKNSVIYLDIETGGRLSSSHVAYVQAWIDGVRASIYRPGVYCSYLETPAQLRQNNEDVFFWVFNINKFSSGQALIGDGEFRTPAVTDSGCTFATAWQFIQNATNVRFPRGDGTSGTLGPVDLDSAVVLDPSQPEGTTVVPSGGATGTLPTITGPATISRGGPAPTFDLGPAPDSRSIFYAVEVSTDNALFDSASHSLEDGYYASWTDSPFLSVNPYQLPDAVWQQLSIAPRLYYRAWFTSSQTEWVDAVVSTPDENAAFAPSINIVDDGSGETPTTRSILRHVPRRHPQVTGPASVEQGGKPPVFTVELPYLARSWRLELSTDSVLLGNDVIHKRADTSYWISKVLPATVSTFAPPAEQWLKFQSADRVFYAISTSPAETTVGWYAQDSSISPFLTESAPWIDIKTADRNRSSKLGATRVINRDELLWRRP